MGEGKWGEQRGRKEWRQRRPEGGRKEGSEASVTHMILAVSTEVVWHELSRN